jgi:hypothetical protein
LVFYIVVSFAILITLRMSKAKTPVPGAKPVATGAG